MTDFCALKAGVNPLAFMTNWAKATSIQPALGVYLQIDGVNTHQYVHST